MIKHISFDLWDTLITSNPEYRTHRNNLLSAIFGQGSQVNPQTVKYAKGTADKIAEITGGQVPYEHFIAACVHDILHDTDIKTFKYMLGVYTKANHDLVLDYCPLLKDNVVEVLSFFKSKGVSMNILSNTSSILGNTLRAVLEKLNISEYFMHMWFSDEMGFSKPNYGVYNKVYMALPNYHNTEILHVGDNPITDSGGGLFESFIISKDNPITNLIKFI